MKALAWAYFAFAQAVTGVCMLLGFAVLALPCALEAWEASPYLSINPAHKGRIDRWSWAWLNPIWGNPEDGVSGQTALIWLNGVTEGPYWPGCPSPRLRAYAWSAFGALDGRCAPGLPDGRARVQIERPECRDPFRRRQPVEGLRSGRLVSA